MRSFRSDNNAGLCPEALAAIVEANDGSHQVGYGDDRFTAEAVNAFRAVFGEEAAVFFLATGSAANTLAIAALTEPWERVLCHSHSHINQDESTGPERLTHCRVSAMDSHGGKISPDDLDRHGANSRGDVHQPQPGVVSISNATEFGMVYTPGEVSAISSAARSRGYRVHMDGARFANAVASLNCDPRDLTSRAGVDALSFGGTKNGLAFGEAVLFFPQGDGSAYERAVRTFPHHRKSAGHLLSKHRFVSAPFAATLRDEVWLRHARHANAMAAELSRGLREAGVELRYPTQANGVFAVLPPGMDEALRARGHQYYLFGDASWNMARFLCSFDTSPADVAALVRDVRACAAAAR